MPRICKRYVKDVFKICQIYSQYMSKTCSDICSKYGQDKLRYAKDMARICPRCDQDMPNTILIYAQDMLKIQIFPRYRVTHPSCHPQKPETRNKQSPELATPKKITGSPTLASLGVASSGLCHFLVVVSTRLNHFQGWPGRESVFFLDSGTIWG